MKHLSSHILKLILAVSALIACANCYADEVDKTYRKESCGFEWIYVTYPGMVGAQTPSGDWIVPLGRHVLSFHYFDKGGKYYGYFQVCKEMDDGKWKSSLISPTGEELIPRRRYGMFFWSEGRMVGTGPNRYETININLSKLLLPSPQADLNQLLIGTWEYESDELDILFDTTKSINFQASGIFVGTLTVYGHPRQIYLGNWTLNNQTLSLKTADERQNFFEKYTVKVLSPSEIELTLVKHVDGKDLLLHGKYRKKQQN